MDKIKEEAEYLRIALLYKLVAAEVISSWADSIILKNESEIPDWALELTFAKTKSINDVVTVLSSIEGKPDDWRVASAVLSKLYEQFKLGKIDFEAAIRNSYGILLHEYNFYYEIYSDKFKGLYSEFMQLDDELDLFQNEEMGSTETVKKEYIKYMNSLMEMQKNAAD